MNKPIILRIAEPCHECWTSMKPNDLGKFCEICKTDVFDFSDLSDGEIVEILKHAPQKVCGKFKRSQIDRPLVFSNETTIKTSNSRFRKMLAATILLSVSSPILNAQAIMPVETSIGSVMKVVEEKQNKKDNKKQELAESYLIRGIVYSEDETEPLVGTSVVLKKDSKIGVMTNEDGEFSLSIPSKYIKNGRVKLEFMYIGMERQVITVDISDNDVLKVYLKEDNTMLMGEIMVVRHLQ